ncbi:hypothetical protein TrVE_jg7993 [Triparma verrucosa]|uniref:FHA domain-containing protein n=2 Tax=Triparma TaxID=722752 RepID=A0A9W7AP49_9STRA|nr:hypothetical protein TrST_g10078 [Triparma strigata]GMH89898.1 hypothetical protein TrVE_jg7993 [Triparma verrucosa]
MGGGGSKPYEPPPAEAKDTFEPPDGDGNYQLILADGKETVSTPLKATADGKPIIVGRSSSQGSTHKSNDDGCSALHLELKWDEGSKRWQAKDLGSSKGTTILGLAGDGPLGCAAPKKLPEGEVHTVEGPVCFHCGVVNTYVTLCPSKVKSVGLEVTKQSEPTITHFKVGDYIPVKTTLSIGRENDNVSGRKTLRLTGVSNVSGTHSLIERDGKFWEFSDQEATHRTVIACNKILKSGTVAIWPGAILSFGHKEKNFDKEPTVIFKVRMVYE